MGNAMCFESGEGDEHLQGLRATLSHCNCPPAKNLEFGFSVDDVPVDNTDFESHSVGVVGLRQDKVSRTKAAKK